MVLFKLSLSHVASLRLERFFGRMPLITWRVSFGAFEMQGRTTGLRLKRAAVAVIDPVVLGKTGSVTELGSTGLGQVSLGFPECS